MKTKVKYNIKKSLFRVLPMALLMGTAFNSCKPEPEPEPHRNVVIDWDWENMPNSDTVEFYAKKQNVDSIILNLRDYNTTSWSPWLFNAQCDEFEKIFNISRDKNHGRGTIVVGCEGGAQMSSAEPGQGPGMALTDSLRCTKWGFRVMTEQVR